MKVLSITTVIAASVLLAGCGGGSTGNSLTTDNGSTVSSTGRPLSGGVSKLPDTVKLACKSTNTFIGEKTDVTTVTESGAQGSIEARCSRNDFVVKEGIPNLNIKRASVVDYWFCTDVNKKSLYGFIHTQDLTKGTRQSIWSNGGKAYIKCDSSYNSPLPTTISSKSSIDDLMDYGLDQDVTAQNCTYSTADQDSSVSCGDEGLDYLVVGTNATFIDGNGKTHKLSKKTTWITSKH